MKLTLNMYNIYQSNNYYETNSEYSVSSSVTEGDDNKLNQEGWLKVKLLGNWLLYLQWKTNEN